MFEFSFFCLVFVGFEFLDRKMIDVFRIVLVLFGIGVIIFFFG